MSFLSPAKRQEVLGSAGGTVPQRGWLVQEGCCRDKNSFAAMDYNIMSSSKYSRLTKISRQGKPRKGGQKCV